MLTDLILGTAGHIDHGKTTLIKALTGVDTDRLPEEKRRGITIELGFAELFVGTYRLGIVDVPGHERLVRNMLAGATGMDLALLVVAADDSVKPQTREHLEILRLLDLPAGVIALTKCDLADDEWVELVEQEVRELVEDTFLFDAPLVRTSATTGQGLDELRERLEKAAATAVTVRGARPGAGPFRMAIDRTFSVAGHGTVVTGSVSSGQVEVGNELVIQPGAIPVRVRKLENHDNAVDQIRRGQRAAVNLAGVHHGQIVRGHELTSPGHLVPSKLFTVSLSLLSTARRALKNRAHVRIHIGTAELFATVSLLNRKRLDPGQTATAQLFLDQPSVATWNQAFVVRSESPVETIGGGKILNPRAEKIRKATSTVLEQLEHLASDDRVLRASAALYFAGLNGWHPDQLTGTAGIEDVAEARSELLRRGDLREIAVTPTRTLRVHQLVMAELSERIETVLSKLHARHPRRSKFDPVAVLRQFDYLDSEPLVVAVLQTMQREGRIEMSRRGVALAGHGAKLSANEKLLLEKIVDRYRQAGFEPPTVKQCQQDASRLKDAIPQLVELAVAEGELVEIARDFYLHFEAEQALRERLRREMSGSSGLTLSQIRGILDTSRKFAIPIAEYLDRVGFTQRQGDLRVLKESHVS